MKTPVQPLSISVGVLTAGRPDLLSLCLNSIQAARGMRPREVIVDENSLNVVAWQDTERLCRRYNAPLWINQDEKPLAACWNFLTSGRWSDASGSDRDADAVVLLNDDVEVPDYWLDAIEHALRCNSEVGIVSLQQWREGSGRMSPRGAVCAPLAVRTVGVGGYCFGFRTADWRAAGGFDEQFWRFYEDLDFGAALTLAGKVNVDLREPRVFHRIGATMGSLGVEVNAANIRMSHAKFIAKWSEKLGLRELARQWAGADLTDPLVRKVQLEAIVDALLRGRGIPATMPREMWTQAFNEREAAGETFPLDGTGDWFVLP